MLWFENSISKPAAVVTPWDNGVEGGEGVRETCGGVECTTTGDVFSSSSDEVFSDAGDCDRAVFECLKTLLGLNVAWYAFWDLPRPLRLDVENLKNNKWICSRPKF